MGRRMNVSEIFMEGSLGNDFASLYTRRCLHASPQTERKEDVSAAS
jgi:hypothetical protein